LKDINSDTDAHATHLKLANQVSDEMDNEDIIF